ncbi:unnamed protein product [Cylicocyclus nassatus]|uniref:VWFA domain-containing protein n=1 Tax=Cylicocyclus nassatus TaxID=53992 RepID=A0AA36GNA1_CYLNA|nr:unnamed protein product [Cylicocyclus nassatus]
MCKTAGRSHVQRGYLPYDMKQINQLRISTNTLITFKTCANWFLCIAPSHTASTLLWRAITYTEYHSPLATSEKLRQTSTPIKSVKLLEGGKAGLHTVVKISCQGMMRRTTGLLTISLSQFIVLVHADVGTFEKLCLRPFQFGSGRQTGIHCEVKYQMLTTKKKQALDLCLASSPFDVLNYTKGYPTKCTYVRTNKCNDDEYSLLDQCLKIKNRASFSEDACGEDYQLYTIESRLEHKWITVFAQRNYFEIWIGNNAETTFLRPRFRKGLKTRDVKKLRIKLRVSTETLDFIPRGTAFYESPKRKLPHLCARPARMFLKTVQEIRHIVEEIGLPTEFANHSNVNDTNRPYFHMAVMIPVRGTKYLAKVEELHEACNVLPSGYVASMRDFRDAQAFAALRANFPSGLYRTTVALRPNATYRKNATCKGSTYYKQLRIDFLYHGPDNTTSQTPHEHWKDKYPSAKCADLPRTTAAMEFTYMDIPAMARRNLVCSYGNPPNFPPVKLEDICNKYAYWDEEKQSCVCYDEDSDGRVKYPEKYGHYPEGAICFDCQDAVHKRSIVFILDGTGTVRAKGWYQQKVFMHKVLDYIVNLRIGIVVITSVSEVVIPLDDYDKNGGAISHFIQYRKYPHSWTAMGAAMYEARMMLQNETNEKVIVMISDGDQDHCSDPNPEVCPELALQRIRDHPQEKEADAIHDAGINLIFVVVGERYKTDDNFKKRVDHIARGVEKAIPVTDFEKFESKKIFEEVVDAICNYDVSDL